MAKAVILDKPKGYVKKIYPVDFGLIRLGSRKYPIAKIEETIPFRVRFTTIMVPGYGVNDVPGIGVQVIGFSNYIL